MARPTDPTRLTHPSSAQLEGFPPFMTINQACQALQLGRSKVYELTTIYDRTRGARGLPFVWFGSQKRVPRAALEQFINNVLRTDSEPTDPAARPWNPDADTGQRSGATAVGIPVRVAGRQATWP
jgi:excisionase family DNA binding protein